YEMYCLILSYLLPVHNLPCFPTRRSSDLIGHLLGIEQSVLLSILIMVIWAVIYITSASLGLYKGIKKLSNLNVYLALALALFVIDRKSTRLNSSHVSISYAVFCLKKKNAD